MLPQSRGFGKLAPWKTKKAEAYVRTLTLDVDYQASTRLGDIQGLISTVTDARTGDVLSANIEEAFAAGVEEALTKLSVNASLEEYFESSVARVNMRLSRLLGEHGLSVDAATVQGAIVAQKGRDVAAAVWGKPSLLLFRQGSQGGPKFFDVLEDDPQEARDHGQGFTNLISGKISGKDRMIISNRNVIELLTEGAVREILSAPKTETATMLLRDALLARYEDLTLALLLLDGAPATESRIPLGPTAAGRSIAPAQPIPITKPALPRNDAVIDRGVDRSGNRQVPNAARRGVTASIIRNVKGGSLNVGKLIGKAANQATDLAGKAATAARGRIEAAREERTAAKEEAPTADMAASRPTSAMASAETVAREKSKRPKVKKAPLPDRLVDTWNSLNPKSRYLLITVMVLVFLLNLSLGALGWRQGRERAIADYEDNVASVRQQLDSAEASMIYRDEERARRLLEEAAAAIAALPTDTEERTVTKSGLETAIAAKYAELRRSVPLGTPEVLAAVATQSGTPELKRLAFDGTYYWSVSDNGDVFRIASDGTAQLMHSAEGDGIPDVFLATRNGALVGDATGLKLVTSGGNSLNMNLPLGDLEVTINDATTFGSRLYFLDSSRNRILRFAAVEGGYGSNSFYVKDATDLSGGVSLAIDGYVYVLNADGSIIRLLRGEKTNFTSGGIDPATSAALLLRTPSDTDDLYVLDGDTPRVIRFDKKGGSLVAQYESDALSGATDFWVDQDSRTIVAVNGNRLLRFTWPEEE